LHNHLTAVIMTRIAARRNDSVAYDRIMSAFIVAYTGRDLVIGIQDTVQQEASDG